MDLFGEVDSGVRADGEPALSAAQVRRLLARGNAPDGERVAPPGEAEIAAMLYGGTAPPVTPGEAMPAINAPAGTHTALWARLATEIRVTAFDPLGYVEGTHEASGRRFRWSVRSVGELQRDALRFVGDLDTWGVRLLGRDEDGKPLANGRDILRVLRDHVPPSPSTESSEPGVEEEREDAATRLCRAALFGPISIHVSYLSGGARTRVTTATEEPGIYGHAGVGLRERDGRSELCLNLTSAIVGPLRDSEFGARVHATPARLARILSASPRLITRHSGVRGLRRGRWWVLDVSDLLAAPAEEERSDPPDARATPATPATPVSEGVAGVASVAAAPEPPAPAPIPLFPPVPLFPPGT